MQVNEAVKAEILLTSSDPQSVFHTSAVTYVTPPSVTATALPQEEAQWCHLLAALLTIFIYFQIYTQKNASSSKMEQKYNNYTHIHEHKHTYINKI